MKILQQSIAKEHSFPCEDAIISYWQDDVFVAGLADGAGGEGLFAREWATMLLQHVPIKPIGSFTDFQAWLSGQWQVFYDTYSENAKSLSPKHFEKFLEEGSGSTLVVAWMQRCGYVNLLSYGDSVSLIYNAADDKLLLDPWVLQTCTCQPYLLNWLTEAKEKAFYRCDTHLMPGHYIILASDAIGQYLLAAYLAAKRHTGLCQPYIRKLLGYAPNRFSNLLDRMLNHPEAIPSFKKVINDLQTAMKTEEDFRQYTEELKNMGFLATDDYSLIFLDNTLI